MYTLPAPASFIREIAMESSWVAPDGTFYGVEDASHSMFARSWFASIGKEVYEAVTALEDAGWLHISGGWIMGAAAKNPEWITEAQMDTLMTIGRMARENDRGYWARGFLHAFARIMRGGTDI